MDSAKPNKIPQLSRLRQPNPISATKTTKIMPPSTISKVIRPAPISSIPPTVSRAVLRRRSKSVSDLTSAKFLKPNNNKVETLPPLKKTISSASTIQGVKRPAITKQTEATKPKVAKIPAYDFKARFLQLEGKHVKLMAELKDVRAKLAEENLASESRISQIALLEEELNKAKSLLVEHEKQTNAHKMELQKSQLENDRLREETQVLKKTDEEKTIELQQAKCLINTLMKEKEHLQSSNEKKDFQMDLLESEIEQSKNIVNDLKHDLSNRNKAYDGLVLENDSKDLERQKLHNDIQDLKGNIRVFCRVRPPTFDESNKTLAYINCPYDTDIEVRKSRDTSSATGKQGELKQEFSFDRVFNTESTQEDIFEELSQLVQSALDGYNVCVFAYGQTGSGKTYTMLGEGGSHAGMIPRSIQLIFEYVEKRKDRNWNFEVQASFLEIYNENIVDLLDPVKKDMDIRFNEGKGVTVSNLMVKPVASSNALNELMAVAHRNRSVAATDFNAHSSRSHAVTKIYLTGRRKSDQNGVGTALTGSLNLVDLAGSECIKTSVEERRVAETKNINKSLSALGNVMLALHQNKQHVPYRDSKLTYLLQSSLGGNSKTLMIVNISPLEECAGETCTSLRFAAKVKEVKTHSKRSRALDKQLK